MQYKVNIPLYGCKFTWDVKHRSDWPVKRKKWSDAELLKIRWLAEYGGWSRCDLKKEYKIPSTMMQYVFDYKAHAWVVPSYDSFTREYNNVDISSNK